MRKIETNVTLANGGMHSARQFKRAKEMLEQCTYKQPRLYHLCFMNSEQKEPYQSALKALCFELRRQNIPVQWKACLEDDEERGFHMHVFLLVEAANKNPCHIINRKENGWLKNMMSKRGLMYYINQPRSMLHQSKFGEKKNYATMPKSKPVKLADCLNWISYLYKNRSKPEHMERIYLSSRNSAK